MLGRGPAAGGAKPPLRGRKPSRNARVTRTLVEIGDLPSKNRSCASTKLAAAQITQTRKINFNKKGKRVIILVLPYLTAGAYSRSPIRRPAKLSAFAKAVKEKEVGMPPCECIEEPT